MPLPKRGISKETAKTVKALLWKGELSQDDIAEQLAISQPSVSKILRGHTQRDVNWPDGSKGHMPVERYEHLNWLHGKRRWERTDEYKKKHKFSPFINKAATMVEEVNRRLDAGENIDDIITEDGVMVDSDKKTVE